MLEKVKKFAKEWGVPLLMVLVVFKSCGTGKDADKAHDYAKETNSFVDSTMKSFDERLQSLEESTPSKVEVRNEMEEVMLDFLIYEDELDKKKITISQIKDKIKEND